eukprot:12421774-Karenia_brevis.AAC.1
MQRIRDDAAQSRANPGGFAVFIGGDWNMHAPGESSCWLDGSKVNIEANPDNCTLLQKQWLEFFDELTELAQPKCTHFHAGHLSENRHDRFYTALPSWMLKMCKIGANIFEEPRSLFKKGISDYAPLGLFFTQRANLPKDAQPISPHLCKNW